MAAINVDMVEIQREIQNIFIVTLRDIFKGDDEYLFDDDDYKTRVLINAPFASDNTEYKVPEIIIMDPSYNVGITGMMNSLADEVRDDNGVLVGFKYINIVDFGLTIQCLSSVEAEAKRLANLIRNYIHQSHHAVFYNKGILISGTQNPSGVPKEQSPEKRWAFSVGVQGTTKLITTQKTSDQSGLLQKINIANYFAGKKLQP